MVRGSSEFPCFIRGSNAEDSVVVDDDVGIGSREVCKEEKRTSSFFLNDGW